MTSSESWLFLASGSSVIPPIKLSVAIPFSASTLAAINDVLPAMQTIRVFPFDSCRELLISSGIPCPDNSCCAVLAFGTTILLLSMPRDFASNSIPPS